MTGRVCPVHGEWSATGVCRWCESADFVQMEYLPPTAHPIVGTPIESITAGELVAEYDWTRGPEVDLLESLSDPLYAEVPPSGELSEAMVGLLARLPPAPREWTLTPALIEVATWHTPPANEGWEEIRLAAQHAALRWERVARRWAAKRPIRCCCGESELDSFGDSRMFRHGTRKWKRHTLKRCDCDLVNPMCQCGEWLFDANYHVAFGEPFAHFAADGLHTPEGCHLKVPP